MVCTRVIAKNIFRNNVYLYCRYGMYISTVVNIWVRLRILSIHGNELNIHNANISQVRHIGYRLLRYFTSYGGTCVLANVPCYKRERSGQVVNTAASYAGVPGFKSRSGDQLSWLRIFHGFSQNQGQYLDCTMKLDNDRFLANPFQFIVHLSPFHSTLCSLSYWESVLK
jgi:hypothetical protein